VRNARLDADNIKVELSGGKVTLRGKVHSLSEKLDAQRAVWSAPGITSVENAIAVSL
jgi:osmotically-inducible protein OsmY